MIQRAMEQYDHRTAKGYLRPEEREFLRFVAGTAGQDGVIVNIGTEYGASLVCFRLGNSNCDIVGIDIDNSKAPKDLRIDFVDGDSSKLFDVIRQAWPIIDVLFVDGDHSYQGALADTTYAELVDIGGYVIFHDCYDYAFPRKGGQLNIHELVPGVNQAVSQWYGTFERCWIEQGPVGTMRIFKRLTCV